LLFVVSGFEKLTGPYQNFLYVIQNYDILNPVLQELTARILPWFELFLGVFLILGLWISWALRGILVLIVSFLFVVGQALIRQLPIGECGCFGNLVSLPLHMVFLLDCTLLFLAVFLLRKVDCTSRVSLDQYFQKQ